MHDPDIAATVDPRAPADARRVVGLDSLRGVAILAVIAYHVGMRFVPGGVVGAAAGLGYTGVQLFFIVSAISMCHVWDQRRGERAPVRSFIIRRLCRIAPPFWFGIVFYMLWRQCGFPADAPIGPLDIALTATFLHGFVPSAINLVVPGGWSIAVEVGFYVLFPMLVPRLRDARSRLVLAVACYVVCTAITSAIRLAAGPSVELFLYYCLLTQLPVFIVGMAIYRIAVKGEPPPRALTAFVGVAWFAIALASHWKHAWLGRFGLWAEVALLALLASVVIGRFEARLLAFAGRFSYSAYLFHFAVLDVLTLWTPEPLRHGLLPFAVALVLTCMGTAVIAWLSSKTLEAWSIACGRALVRRVNEPACGVVKPAQ